MKEIIKFILAIVTIPIQMVYGLIIAPILQAIRGVL
jgi:hypothetical protein